MHSLQDIFQTSWNNTYKIHTLSENKKKPNFNPDLATPEKSNKLNKEKITKNNNNEVRLITYK